MMMTLTGVKTVLLYDREDHDYVLFIWP